MDDDPYDLLDVPRDASGEAIRAAFRKQARRWHPDRCNEPDAAERFMAIKQARDTLLDPAKRAALDDPRARLIAVFEEFRRRNPAPAQKPPTVPQPEPPGGLFVNIAGLYARDMGLAQGALFMLLGAALDREFGTDRLTPPTRRG